MRTKKVLAGRDCFGWELEGLCPQPTSQDIPSQDFQGLDSQKSPSLLPSLFLIKRFIDCAESWEQSVKSGPGGVGRWKMEAKGVFDSFSEMRLEFSLGAWPGPDSSVIPSRL